MIPKSYKDLTDEAKNRPFNKALRYYKNLLSHEQKHGLSELDQKRKIHQKAIIEVTCQHFGYWNILLFISDADSSLEAISLHNIDVAQTVGEIWKPKHWLSYKNQQFSKTTFNFN